MEQVWEIIAPYVAMLGGSTITGTITYIITRLLTGRVLNKNTTALNQAFNVDNLSQRVAERLSGKTLNIDVTAVTEKALRKLARELDAKIEKIAAMTNSLRGILAPIGKGIIKLKALTKEEIAELASAIKTLEGEYKPPEPDEVMTVVLQPLALDEERAATAPTAVNFGGLE